MVIKESFLITIDQGFPVATAINDTGDPHIACRKSHQDLLRLLISRTHLVGLDLVEVSPPYDPAGVTTTLAARLVLDAMGFAMAKREKSEL